MPRGLAVEAARLLALLGQVTFLSASPAGSRLTWVREKNDLAAIRTDDGIADKSLIRAVRTSLCTRVAAPKSRRKERTRPNGIGDR